MAQRRAVRVAAVGKVRHRGLVTIGAAGVLVLLVAVVPATSANAGTSTKVRNTPTGSLVTTLEDPGATSSDFFGLRGVALAGTTAVVGAPLGNSGAGVVYIYQKGASGWPSTPTATLPDPKKTVGDEFGLATAASVSGTTVIVGAPGAKSTEGAAYIYVKGSSGWSTTPTITMSDPAATSGDDYGFVAVWKKIAFVGAPGTNSNEGMAYIYKA
jgi:hypothetical protein